LAPSAWAGRWTSSALSSVRRAETNCAVGTGVEWSCWLTLRDGRSMPACPTWRLTRTFGSAICGRSARPENGRRPGLWHLDCGPHSGVERAGQRQRHPVGAAPGARLAQCPGERPEQIVAKLKALLANSLEPGCGGRIAVSEKELVSYTGVRVTYPDIFPSFTTAASDPWLLDAQSALSAAFGPRGGGRRVALCY